MFGRFGAASTPIPLIRYFAVIRSPVSVVTVQAPAFSSKSARVTVVSNRMSRSRSSRSARNCR
jgi:hypothetical protein